MKLFDDKYSTMKKNLYDKQGKLRPGKLHSREMYEYRMQKAMDSEDKESAAYYKAFLEGFDVGRKNQQEGIVR